VAFSPGGGLLATANFDDDTVSMWSIAPPTATISAPAGGQTYTAGQSIATAFSCADTGAGIASCVDSRGATDGAGRLDTSAPGSFTYTVKAASRDGQTASSSISYTVVAAPVATTTAAPPTATPPPAPTRISDVALSKVVTWCATCRYPSARLRFRLNRAVTVRLVLRVRSDGHWRQDALATLRGHEGANRFRLAGRWHGHLVPAGRVQILVELHPNGRWVVKKRLGLTVHSPFTRRVLHDHHH
jgi:hypothetical protein